MSLRSCLLAVAVALALPLGASESSFMQGRGPDPGVFATPLNAADLAPGQDAVWLDGKASPFDSMDKERHKVLWTRTTPTTWQVQTYGAGTSLGVRHLRLAFSRDVAVGSVFALGNGRLSILKPDVKGVGDLGNEAQWIPAERLDGRSVSTAQPTSDQALTLWVLPPGSTTRALRFSHLPAPADNELGGRLGGVYLLAGRYADLAPQGRVAVSAETNHGSRLNDGIDNNWGLWSNGDKGAEQVVSPDHPADIVLAFPAPVALRGLATWACGARDASLAALPKAGVLPGFDDPAWKPLKDAGDLVDWYPLNLRTSWIDLGSDAVLGSLRVRLTAPADPKTLHPHQTDNTKDGHRVWLDEVIALMPLAERPLSAAILPAWPETTAHPPIAVPFHLDQPGHVTLVIEDAAGKRLRNLVADAPYPAGDNTAWWDGLDDLGRDTAAASHGLYHVPGSLVAPGTYIVRGLSGPQVTVHYEFSPDDAGEPPWSTADNTGGWGTNHTPPSCAAFVAAERTVLNTPLVFIGSYIAEGGHGLFWVDLDGKKRGGVGWVGGTWTGAQTLAADSGPKPVPTTAVYVASGFNGEVRFTSLARELNERGILTLTILNQADKAIKPGDLSQVVIDGTLKPTEACRVRDLAARDGLLVASLPALNELWFVDAPNKRLIARVALAKPSGVAFDSDGSVLATSGDRLVRLVLPELVAARAASGPAFELHPAEPSVVLSGLDQPYDLGLTPSGDLVISEWGVRHQVRLFRRDGKLLRAIGKPGAPAVGPYDPLHLDRPAGVATDDRGRLWITEASSQPKRVGVWGADGTLQRAWYGPSRYGGGGTLDPADRTRFYNLGMAFRLDWKAGTVAVDRILWPDAEMEGAVRGQFPPDSHGAGGLPETPFRVGGRQFFSNWANSNPTNGASMVTLWEDRRGSLSPIAAVGSPWGWKLLETPAFAGCWPTGVTPDMQHKPKLWCTWTDRDGDGVMQPAELSIRPGQSGGVTVQADLSFVLRLDDKIVRIKSSVAAGPVTWAFDAPEVLLSGAQGCASSGGDTNLLTADKRVFSYPPPLPFSNYSVGGGTIGAATWSYPNMWPGLHASHEAMVPDHPGLVIGATRLLGLDVTPRGGDAGPLIFLNQNMGNVVVFTSDGLLVTTLFEDSRTGQPWRMPGRTRNMRVDQLTLHDETFWPTVTQCTDDGTIYMCTGAASVSSLVRVDGLERIRRFPAKTLTVDAAVLARCTAWQADLERERQALSAPRVITVPLGSAAPTVDGDLSDWAGADWASVDERGTGANFNSNSKPYAVYASLRISGDRLYAAWRSNENDLAVNSAEQATAPFKTGSALDLMLGTDPAAPADRRQAAPGDLRLLVTRRPDGKGTKTWAVLYRAVVPGTADGAKVPFSSPWRTITFDVVTDVSAAVELAQKEGDYEMSIPLAALGLKPTAGARLRGDLGVLRGRDGQTGQRVYWSNKATGITADVPSEAELQPGLWGTFELK